MDSNELRDAVGVLIEAQAGTNTRLDRIEDTLGTSSKFFALMHERLEHLEEGQQALIEGQQTLVVGQRALVEGQQAVIERLDHLVRATLEERTRIAERIGALDVRLERVERHVFPEGPEPTSL